ncbi:MAG: hypothetical protein RL338_1376 [Chloroflexota bacterium]
MSDAVATETSRYRVRFDECGADGVARSASYLRWAQDLAWLHSERLGYDRAWYEARGMTWLARSIELEIGAPVAAGAGVVLTTRLSGFRRVWARRRTGIRDGAGTPIGRVLTDWVMTDARGLPARVPPEFLERFDVVPGSFEPVRVELPDPPAGAHLLELVVRPHEVDPLGHANNAVYLDWVDEAVAAIAPPAGPRRYRLEYLFPALPGERLAAVAWRLPDGRLACRIDAIAGERRERARATVEPIGTPYVPSPDEPLDEPHAEPRPER